MVFDGNNPLNNYSQLLFLACSCTVDKAGTWSYMVVDHSLRVFLYTTSDFLGRASGLINNNDED